MWQYESDSLNIVARTLKTGWFKHEDLIFFGLSTNYFKSGSSPSALGVRGSGHRVVMLLTVRWGGVCVIWNGEVTEWMDYWEATGQTGLDVMPRARGGAGGDSVDDDMHVSKWKRVDV
ncbi:hypothetical protein L210DRAFT_3510575, partial [Boletus edulis BED1]